jgi:hypothetical protein
LLQGWPPEDSTWEPAQNILDANLIRDWQAECQARKAEAWELEEATLQEEPITADPSDDKFNQQLEEAMQGMGRDAAEHARQALTEAAKVRNLVVP